MGQPDNASPAAQSAAITGIFTNAPGTIYKLATATTAPRIHALFLAKIHVKKCVFSMATPRRGSSGGRIIVSSRLL
jgi:hypothetical protein